jgi:hypothetical protein
MAGKSFATATRQAEHLRLRVAYTGSAPAFFPTRFSTELLSTGWKKARPVGLAGVQDARMPPLFSRTSALSGHQVRLLQRFFSLLFVVFSAEAEGDHLADRCARQAVAEQNDHSLALLRRGAAGSF